MKPFSLTIAYRELRIPIAPIVEIFLTLCAANFTKILWKKKQLFTAICEQWRRRANKAKCLWRYDGVNKWSPIRNWSRVMT